MYSDNKSIAFSGTIVIIIFIVLCLTVMAVLSFTTANSDYKLTKKAENKIVDYYFINGQAEEKLSSIIDEIMLLNNSINFNISEFNKENYIIMLRKKLKDSNEVKINNSALDSYFIIGYEVEGNENQKINIELKVEFPLDKAVNYEIVSWNLLNIELPDYSENLNLWEGIDNEDY